MSFAQQLREAQFVRLGEFTRDQLDERARKGDNVLMENVAWFPDLTLPTMAKGWRVIYAGSQKTGERGKIVLLPDRDDEARRCYLDGQYLTGINAGLTKDQADTWSTANTTLKHAVLPTLVKVLKDQNLQDGYAAWDYEMTRAAENEWRQRYKIVDNHTRNERRSIKALIALLKAPPQNKRAERAKKYGGKTSKIPGVLTLEQGWQLVLELGSGIHLPFTYQEYAEEHHRRVAANIGLTDAEIRALMAQVQIDHLRDPNSAEVIVADEHAPVAPANKPAKKKKKKGKRQGTTVVGARQPMPSVVPESVKAVESNSVEVEEDDGAESEADAIRTALSRDFSELQLGDKFLDADGVRWAKISYEKARAEQSTATYTQGTLVNFRDDESCWPEIIELEGARHLVKDLQVSATENDTGWNVSIGLPDTGEVEADLAAEAAQV